MKKLQLACETLKKKDIKEENVPFMFVIKISPLMYCCSISSDLRCENSRHPKKLFFALFKYLIELWENRKLKYYISNYIHVSTFSN